MSAASSAELREIVARWEAREELVKFAAACAAASRQLEGIAARHRARNAEIAARREAARRVEVSS